MADIKEIMESIKESLLDPVKEAVDFRLKSAFFGTFIISWMIFNWDKIAYFILSDDKVISKILILKSEYPPPGYDHSFFSSIGYNVLPSLLCALSFTFLYPFSTYFIKQIHKWIYEQIDSLDEKKQLKTIARRKAIEIAIVTNEGEKNKLKATFESEISLERLNSLINNEKTDGLRKELNDNKLESDRLKTVIESQESLLKKQVERKVELTNELNELNEKLYPLRNDISTHKKLIDDLALAEQRIEIFEKKMNDNEEKNTFLNEQLETAREDFNRHTHYCRELEEITKESYSLATLIKREIETSENIVNLLDENTTIRTHIERLHEILDPSKAPRFYPYGS